MEHQLVIVLDFGGKLNQLVARRIRELGVYCEVMPYHSTTAQMIKEKNPIGIFFVAGGADATLPLDKFDPEILNLSLPILGIGYGGRLLAHLAGAKLESPNELHQLIPVHFTGQTPLLSNTASQGSVWMEYNQNMTQAPAGYTILAEHDGTILGIAQEEKKRYGLFFQPEIKDTTDGILMIRNFLFDICGATGDWSMESFAQVAVEQVKQQVGNGKVLLALSGGVDSSVVAKLLEKAVGKQLYCIFVDHGFMRKNEGDEVEAAFANSGIHFVRVDAEQRFLGKTAGVTDPEQKRKIIGEEFIRVFEEEAKKIGTVDFLAQGTIYPDIIESDIGDGTVIKSHHNVGGLPDYVDFKEIIEPLRLLFKDEVRELGRVLGLSSVLVNRQPFPGPGLAVRCIGEMTKERLDLLRDADYIYREEIAKAGLDTEINQYFAVLTNMRSVGVSGDTRTYDYTIALRAVITNDFMTAEWAKIPYDVLEIISRRIVTEVGSVNRIVYDITTKPPATIEWE